ncbi:hypothetical protein DRH29_05355 [candidate division Kazan bacterium]|uniref:Uncharacterized protein n=1 Tax=candidate division Kazan bacterium TaxID=2202143 RepID=A0A420ZB80_UNCK3|nr:MAG: hypothetical protein DRH29_05355 [candidate division Kazan bacterium]
MSITAIQSKRGIILLPRPTKRPVCSVKIQGTEYKSDLLEFEVRRFCSQAVSFSRVVIKNFGNQYTGRFRIGNVIQLYADYSDGTTKILEGKVVDVKYHSRPYQIELLAKDYGQDAMNRIVNKSYTSTSISSIFTDLISTYLSGHTTNNVETNSTQVSIAWSGKKLWHCLQDLVKLTANTWEFYCDFDKDWHFFNKTTKTSSTEALSYTRNLIGITPLTSISDVKHKIMVYGKSIEGLPLFYSKTTGYGEDAEDIVIKDSNLTTLEMVKNKVDELVTAYSSTEAKGRGESLGMPTLNPGEKVYIFSPPQNIQGWYLITSFTHKLTRHRFRTRFEFQEAKKRVEDLSTFLGERKIIEQEISEIMNEFDLDYSWILDFDDSTYIDESNSSNVERSNNFLQLTSGASSGTFVSISYTTDSNVSKFALRVVGDAISDITFYVSVDNGLTYQQAVPETLYNATSEGNQIRIKAVFSDSSQKIKVISIEYS